MLYDPLTFSYWLHKRQTRVTSRSSGILFVATLATAAVVRTSATASRAVFGHTLLSSSVGSSPTSPNSSLIHSLSRKQPSTPSSSTPSPSPPLSRSICSLRPSSFFSLCSFTSPPTTTTTTLRSPPHHLHPRESSAAAAHISMGSPSSAADQHFDLFVIGAGSGGMACARRAAAYGASVGIGEHKRLGGTCVNVGCVPKKVMWNAANLRELMSQGGHYGLGGGGGDASEQLVPLNWEKLKSHRDAYVKRLNGIYDTNLRTAEVKLYHQGFCSLEGDGKIRVQSRTPGGDPDKIVSADHILIAVGGQAEKLGITGQELAIDSDGFFELEHQPRKVAVVGAGYIAVELVGIFHALGTETHLFVRGECALRKFDEMLKWSLDKDMKAHGIHVHPGSIPKSITKDSVSGELSLHLENGSDYGGFDTVLVARGRTPLVEGLGLDKGGVQTTPNGGHVKVDEYQNTTVSGVYALGDVCGKVELTPMAIAAGRRLADRLFGGQEKAKADYEFVPTCIFTHPPIGTVGLTEDEAKEKYGELNINIYKTSSVNLFYGPFQVAPADKPKTFMKLICLKENERIIGAHVYGMGADEMIQGFGVAIKMGATKTDFDNCVAVHPTAAEELVTIPPWGLKEHPKPMK
eukprot:GHVS01023858.1.p1 GENE.GHVS01023858.1~~GHVS01023858.1.p1  ORF type:complete len:633 (+),score=132.40 GHVS01023858.1:70-1968(+)